MKKTFLILLVAGLVVGTTSAIEKKKVVKKTVTEKIINNEVDSMSYALGVNFASRLNKDFGTLPGGKINKPLFIKAFNTVMAGDSTVIKQSSVENVLKNYFTKANAADLEKKKTEGAAFLAQNAKKEGVNVTASGLQYIILKNAQGPTPGAKDTVKVDYVGTLIDGTKFDSSIDRGKPADFPVDRVIPGFTEGLKLMPLGSKFRFFIPYNLGYGEQGASQTIPPYSTLIFDVELLEIKPFKEVQATITDTVTIKTPAEKITEKTKKSKK